MNPYRDLVNAWRNIRATRLQPKTLGTTFPPDCSRIATAYWKYDLTAGNIVNLAVRGTTCRFFGISLGGLMIGFMVHSRDYIALHFDPTHP